MMDERVRAAWEAYQDSRSREAGDRQRLRAAIRSAIADGASQSDIARALGRSRQYVSKLLSGG